MFGKNRELSSEELNKQYADIVKKMLTLNEDRARIYLKFKKKNPDMKLNTVTTASLNHDLMGNMLGERLEDN